MNREQEWTEYRRSQLKPLEGARFRLQTYRPRDEHWNHDHCCGCWAKFAGSQEPGSEDEGYVTHIKSPAAANDPSIIHDEARGIICFREPIEDGHVQRWVCRQCFAEFAAALGFKVDTA